MKYCNQCHATYPTDFTTCPKDQSALVATAELVQGMVLRGKYEVLERIGAGGMATVYRVRHLHLKEDVAIKVVSSSLAGDSDFLDRFQTEAVVTRKLRHPNAVRLDDFDVTDDGRPFIVMEFVRGSSLRSLLQNGWLAPARAAGIARQVALALGAAHELGIVHRDIKPENILLIAQPDGSDLVKVLDFGIARVNGELADVAAGHTPTRTGIILGTPQYVSPEQAKGVRSALDGRSDLYSLGVVLYEMLTGDLPFHADNPFDLLLQHIQATPTAPHLANQHAGISPVMSELVMKALEKDPYKRFQSASEMAEALSDPAVSERVEPESSAHAFSTAALAAAAASASDSPARATLAASDATLPLGSNSSRATSGTRATKPVAADRATVMTGDATLPMGSSAIGRFPTSAAKTSAAAQTVAAPVKPRFRRWYIAAAACLALALGGWGISSLRSQDPAPADNAVQAAAPLSTTTTPAPRPVRTVHKNSTRPAAPSPAVSNAARAQELTSAGYRRLEQRDYAGARENFEEALALDPNNASARRGLQLSQGAQTVDTISGILRR